MSETVVCKMASVLFEACCFRLCDTNKANVKRFNAFFFLKNVCLNVVVVVSLAYLFLTLSSGGKNSKIGKK